MYDPCQGRWEVVGTASGTPCSDRGAVFSVDDTFEEEWGPCSPGYGSPRAEDYHGSLGFALGHEAGGAVLGPVVSGSLYWGGGSVLGPATASAEVTVVQRQPLELAWAYRWSDPWGYYYSESWSGEMILR